MSNSFADKIYQTLEKVPPGRVTTYGDLAFRVGHPGAARAVGTVLNKNPYAPAVPCHRVVKSDGSIGGYAGGIKKKIAMLKKEGVEVRYGKVAGFERIRL